MIRGALDPKSNRETFRDNIALFANGVQLDLTGVTAKIQLEGARDCYPFSDYTTYPGYGLHSGARLLATTENGGAEIVDGSSILFTFTAAQMSTLPSGQYRLSAVATNADGDLTIQLFQLQISIIDGGVPMT
jgi:hypothetical protein